MKPIYLDNNSTTMIDPRVVNCMIPYLNESYGNASSSEHIFGWEANNAVNEAREHISSLINCSPNDIIFTSGATEANNISILGSASKGIKHAITVKTEHKSVLDVFKSIPDETLKVDYLDVDQTGTIDVEFLKDKITNNTQLISVMMVNNEIGVIQPIKEIGELCRSNNIILHVDAAQALGKMDINLNDLNIDLLSLSAHKIYGPKGIGCLYINHPKMKNKISPTIFGGSQERALRPGTLSVSNIVGFGEACRILNKEISDDIRHVDLLTNTLYSQIESSIDNINLNGPKKNRISGNLNITFKGLNNEPIIPKLRKIAISSGSACTSSSPEPSHVLEALNIDKKLIKSTIRIGVGKFNTIDEIKFAGDYIARTINKLK